MKPVSGSRCECAACGQRFNRVSTFDKHRVGEFAKPGESHNTRACLSIDEMQAKGWLVNRAGYWITGGVFWKKPA